MAWRPTRAQFYTLGLPASACTAASRQVESVDLATDTLIVRGHGYSEGDLLRFETSGDTAVLAVPLSATSLYAVAPGATSDLFQVRLGGVLVNFTVPPVGVMRCVEDFGPRLDVILEHRARWCDDHAIPYTPPFETPPESLVIACCKLSALDVAMVLRSSSPSYSLDDVKAAAAGAQVFLDKLRSGAPLAVTPVDQTPGKTELGARAFSRRPPRGWKTSAL